MTPNTSSRFRHNTVYVAIHLVAYFTIISAILSWIVVGMGIGYGAFAPHDLNFSRLIYFIFQAIILSGIGLFFYECTKHITWRTKPVLEVNDPDINHKRQMGK